MAPDTASAVAAYVMGLKQRVLSDPPAPRR